MLRLSIIIPTIGRPTLRDTVESIGPLEAGDEILICSDGWHRVAYDCLPLNPACRLLIQEGPSGDWGGSARNLGLWHAQGTCIAYMDDDDVFLPGAIDAIRGDEKSGEVPYRPFPTLFRVRRPTVGDVLWTDPVLRWKNVTTQMLVHPNIERLPRWGALYGADFEFIKAIAERFRGIRFEQQIIAEIRHVPSSSPPPGANHEGM
jgi:glycosyltransferase involved in cell wall biosynthesis